MAKKQRGEWFSRLMKRVKKHGPSSGIILAAAIFLGLSAWLSSLSWKTGGESWVVEDFDDLRNVFLIVAGCVGGGFVYWRTSIASTDAETKKQNGINNMYTIAIEQLGKEHEKGRPNLEVRIGALYSLEKLAQANPDYRQSIMDVLCSYVRNNAPLSKDQEKPEEHEYASQYKDKPRTDIQTALTIIGRSNAKEGSRQPIDLSNCYSAGANLQGMDLQEANLQEASLQGAELQWANLQSADLQEASLQGAELQWANLQWANLQGANLQGAELQWANLQWANLQWANLQSANLQEADLQEANLIRAELQGAKLQGAKLQGAELQGAELQGATLQSATLQEATLWKANLLGADLQGATLQGADLQGADLQGADLEGTDLRACRNLTCEQLRSARNWQRAKHDLDCGADIPNPSEKDKKEA